MKDSSSRRESRRRERRGPRHQPEPDNPEGETMNATSHQTPRLSRGRHVSPREGTCVMELASILAGESFSDHPRSACPVLGTIMRCYNDGIDDDRRQDLYWCAAAVVGTRSRAARAERIRRAAEFFGVRLTRLERAVPRF